MFHIIIRVVRLLKNQKKLAILITLLNIIFAVLILVEPIFFREVIDILVNYSDDSSSSQSKLTATLLLWAVIGIFTIAIRLFVSIHADRMAHREFDRSVF